MKKMLALLLALCLLCMGAFALAEAEDVSGVWYLTAFESDGVELPTSLLGIEMTMTLNTDGTALLESNMAETEIGTWMMNGDQLEVDDAVGDTQVFALVDGRLVGEQDGMKLILTREVGENAVQEASPVRTDATREEFNGVWNGSYVELGGMQLPVSMLDMNIGLEITTDKVLMTSITSDGSETQEQEFSFADGVLTIGDDVMSLKLHENGMASFTDEDAGMTLYFEKTAE